MLAVADKVSEAVLTATLDLEAVRQYRADWHVFADRRTDLYGALLQPPRGKANGGG
jgi:N-carbamoylputrescine amidase